MTAAWARLKGKLLRLKAWLERKLDALQRAVESAGEPILCTFARHKGFAPRALLLILFVGLALVTAIRGFDSVLAEMHRADAPSRNFASVAGLRFGAPDTGAASTSVAIWRSWAGDPARAESQFSTPDQVLGYYFWLDTAFLAVYVLFLLIALAVAYERLGTHPPGTPAAAAVRRARFRRLTAFAAPLVFVAATADFVENVLTRRAYDVCALDGCGVWFAYPLAAAALAKYLFFLLVLVPLLYALLAIPEQGAGGDWERLWRTIRVLRVQVIVVVVFGLALFGPIFAEQGADTMRRWPNADVSDGVLAAALAVLFALLTFVLSRRLVVQDRDKPRAAADQGRISLLLILAVGAALAALGRVLGDDGSGLLALGLILVVIAVLSYPVRHVQVEPPDGVGMMATTLATLVAIAPLVLLALAMVAAASPQLAYTRETEYLSLVIGAAVLIVAALLGYVALARSWPSTTHTSSAPQRRDRDTFLWVVDRFLWVVDRNTFLWVVAAVVACVYAATALNPWWTGDKLGAVGLLLIFLAAVSLLGYAAQRLDKDWQPPQVFAVVGFTRMPVVLVLAVWAVLAAQMDDGGYHDARLVTGQKRAAAVLPGTTAQQAWTDWLGRQSAWVSEEGGGRPAIPLVLVAAEGGGLRAAYWAANALDCAVDGDKTSCGYELGGEEAAQQSLFALSGASGGSLGLSSYVAASADGVTGEAWVEDRLGRDFVAPLWASLLFVDFPNAFLKLNLLPDRAAVLERAWEQPWHEDASLFQVPESDGPLAAGLFGSYASGRAPLLLLSGTSVLDGCRVNNSVVVGAVAPVDPKRAPACDSMQAFERPVKTPPVFTATYDLGRALCAEQDVRLSTAALLSARFPFVSPSGRVELCESKHAIFVVDGGYYDNTGASALLELWARIEPLVHKHNAASTRSFCVVPTFLHLDNHVRTPPQADPRGRPLEASVPLTAAGAIRSGHDGDVRQAAAAAFQGSFGTVPLALESGSEVPRYAYVYPRAEPGADAPLGWALSKSSTAALEKQLSGENKETLRSVRRWFSADLSCDN